MVATTTDGRSTMPKEFVVAFMLMFSLLWFYLLTTRFIGGAVFFGLVGLTFAVAVVLYRIEDVKQLQYDAKAGTLLATMQDIQRDVYAKAEAVRRMGEDIAGAVSYALTGMGRFAPEDLESHLGAQREQIAEMLRKIGSDTDRITDRKSTRLNPGH